MLFAIVNKELLLLRCDRAGLLVLFVMPMLLVLVLSLVQDNLFRATGESRTRALLVNRDEGALGRALADKLEATGALELVEEFAGQRIDVKRARERVFSGDYQFALVIPADFSTTLNSAALDAVRAALTSGDGEAQPVSGELHLYFDPTVRGVYRTAVTNAVQRGLLGLEIARKSEALGQVLPEELQKRLDAQYGDYAPDIREDMPQLAGDWAARPLVRLEEQLAYPQKFARMPTSVQQNVPAWTLFGMFFIVVPLAGTLIRERQEGTLTRLLAMPVGLTRLLFGKVLAYMMVCVLQMLLMLVVGCFVLPLLGTPALTLGSAPLALGLVAFSAALAACGYGVLVGVLANSYEQASTFGAVSVVIAAAVGGVMVPVYVMPRVMQQLSVISPLGWGLNAFLDIFVRDGGVETVLPNVAALGAFFCVCMATATLLFQRRRREL